MVFPFFMAGNAGRDEGVLQYFGVQFLVFELVHDGLSPFTHFLNDILYQSFLLILLHSSGI